MQDGSDNLIWNPVEWKNVGRPDLPLDNLFSQVRTHLRMIEKAQEVLREAKNNFTGIYDIWRSHCDFALTALERLAEPIEACSRLVMRQGEDFPAGLYHQWCRIALKLCHIQHQNHTLKTLLISTSCSDQSFSRYMLSQRKEIYFRIKDLLTSCNEFCQETIHLLEEAQLLSRQDYMLHSPLYPEKDSLYEKNIFLLNFLMLYARIVPLHNRP